jgi:hypothetical protein
MDALFDLLLLLGGISVLYSVLGLVAGIAERSIPIQKWVWRLLAGGN